MRRLMTTLILLPLVVCGPAGADAGDQRQPTPKLVVQITVDQLRGDALDRFGERFVEGGFRYLLENGTHYANAHYRHANTETAPGHASLVTGTFPTRHGIVANDWINTRTGEFVYNTDYMVRYDFLLRITHPPRSLNFLTNRILKSEDFKSFLIQDHC